MAESVEAIDPIKKKKDEHAVAALAAEYSLMLEIRRNSVINDERPGGPQDAATVQSPRASTAARSIALANKLRQIAARETAAGKAIEKKGAEDKAILTRAMAADQQKADTERDMTRAQEHEVSIQQQRAVEYRKQQDGATAGFNNRDREEAAAFLKAKGYELLSEAGEDPVKIQQALDLLSESGIESERAAELYHATYSMARGLGSEAALAELMAHLQGTYAKGAEADESSAAATVAKDAAGQEQAQSTIHQGQAMQFEAGVLNDHADLAAADDMPWNITPVKT